MTRNDSSGQEKAEQQLHEDEQDSPLELDDETLSDLTADQDAEDVRGGTSARCPGQFRY